MTDKPRLIEVAFPLKEASLASVHEKNVRHGHISTLHIWPARRPLAACRAALLATLLPDPGDAQKRKELLELIGGTVVRKTVTSEDEDGNSVSEEKEVVEGGVLVWGNENAATMDTLRAAIRDFYGGQPPKVLDPFAGGGAIPLEAMRLGCEVASADLNPVAWFIQKCTLEYPQRFAGRKWPLPDFVRNWPDFVEDYLAGKIKKRKGEQVPHFSDPVNLELHEAARDIEAPSDKASADFRKISLPDADLAWHVRAWGRWVLERARQELAGRYPAVPGEQTVAYLWARTGRDPQTAGRIPLLKTFWVCNKRGKRAALLPIPHTDGSGVSFRLLQEADLAQPQRIVDEYEFLRRWEVTAETFEAFIKEGTMNRAGVWSPCAGRPGVVALTREDLRRQGKQRLLDKQMIAVVLEARVPGKKKIVKRYRLPTELELRAADVGPEDIAQVFNGIPFGVPGQRIVEDAKRNTWCVDFGIETWDQLFTARQLLALGVFAKQCREAMTLIARSDENLSLWVGAYLLCTFDKMLDYENVCTSWYLNNEQITHLFNRFAIPLKWDFAEASPIGGASGSWASMLSSVTRSLDTCVRLPGTMLPPAVRLVSAKKTASDHLDAVVTDPPYYEAIGYAVVMDFFYVWLRRCLSGVKPEFDSAFAEELSPKWNHEEDDGELVDDASRFGGDSGKSKLNYETGMGTAFQRFLASLGERGRLVIVFANKSVDAWETLVGALIRGGAEVTASWPIQTEMPNRTRGISSAALSSSVWIVGRKRSAGAQPGWEEQVMERMKSILFDLREELGGKNILQYYFDLGIRGPDFIWAALGPALQAYSEHPFVKKTGGGVVTVQEFLDEVRKLVLQFALGELPGFREVQQETQGRGETITLDPVTQYYLLHRAYFGLEPAPAGACILYANACGKDETELKVVWNILEQGGKSGPGKKGRPRKEEADGEQEEAAAEETSGNEYRLLDWSERAGREHLGDSRGGLPSPLVDKVHRMMGLFQRNQAAEVQQLYEEWGLASERAFPPLLQAIRELALEDGNETERRLVEALATQLKLTRRQVDADGALKESPFFAAIDQATRTKVSYRKQK